jgi:hypothetical protein
MLDGVTLAMHENRFLRTYRRLAYLHESHFTGLVWANTVNAGCGSGNSTCEIMHQAAREQLWLNWDMFTNANCTDGAACKEIPQRLPRRQQSEVPGAPYE